MAGEDADEQNGLLFNGVYVPQEVLVILMSYLDAKAIVKFRRVCKRWRDVASSTVWHEKARREIPGVNPAFLRNHKLSWVDFFWICHKKPFHKNVIANPCGKEKLKFWNVTNGGDGWEVEDQPNGCEPFPKDFKSCFVTSYGKCSAEQQIDLRAVGLTQAFMDEVNPVITISDWYVARWDCGIEYKISVSLLNSHWEAITSFHFNDKLVDGDRTVWKNVKHEFKNYGKGVRSIQFYHSGKDTQFWAGHYGAKMTGAEVTISLPDEPSSSTASTSPKKTVELEEDSDWMSASASASSSSPAYPPNVSLPQSSSSTSSLAFESNSNSSDSSAETAHTAAPDNPASKADHVPSSSSLSSGASESSLSTDTPDVNPTKASASPRTSPTPVSHSSSKSPSLVSSHASARDSSSSPSSDCFDIFN